MHSYKATFILFFVTTKYSKQRRRIRPKASSFVTHCIQLVWWRQREDPTEVNKCRFTSRPIETVARSQFRESIFSRSQPSENERRASMDITLDTNHELKKRWWHQIFISFLTQLSCVTSKEHERLSGGLQNWCALEYSDCRDLNSGIPRLSGTISGCNLLTFAQRVKSPLHLL